jgi:hypothetical protein
MNSCYLVTGGITVLLGATVNITFVFPTKPPSSISMVAVRSFLMNTKMLFFDLVEETKVHPDFWN